MISRERNEIIHESAGWNVETVQPGFRMNNTNQSGLLGAADGALFPPTAGRSFTANANEAFSLSSCLRVKVQTCCCSGVHLFLGNTFLPDNNFFHSFLQSLTGVWLVEKTNAEGNRRTADGRPDERLEDKNILPDWV